MELWEKHLSCTKEKNYNIEHLESVKQNSSNLVYNYVLRCLNILKNKNVNDKIYFLVSETLKWMDVAKTGSKSDRVRWKNKNYNLFIHNISSSLIYKDEVKNYNEIVYILIKTHGLIGQHLRGETLLSSNKELYDLIERKLISKDELKSVLIVLNECVIGGVSTDLYNKIKNEVNLSIDKIVNNKFDNKSILDRVIALNSGLSTNELNELKDILKNREIYDRLNKLFNEVDFWFYEVSISDFSILEQIKILLICSNKIKDEKNITFEKIMRSMYIDYDNKKVTNLFKKRIVEKYLSSLNFDEILCNKLDYSPHINFKFIKKEETLLFDFKFSVEASKLIDFCMVASKSNALYKKSIYMLYDLFGFRKDEYDRFYNEIEYLYIMNSSLQFKAKILDFMVGKNILDVGPGGGALMNLIEEKDPTLNVYGIDISSNVIEELNNKKIKENRKWNIVKGDALELQNYFKKGQIDTIIYSSIIHELYSYIKFENKRFNINTVKKALKSAYDILPIGGRIIIRDGIKTEPENQYRIIEFKDLKDNEILDRYCHDFKGRKITYERISESKVKMLVNDAMEFLYTYTWGEDSYPLEVNEQFGYLTPSEYVKLINDNLLNSKIIKCHAFLQEGYEENLLNKISIYDETMNVVKLPNSTCIIVIEKGK